MKKTLKDFNFNGKRALVRVDFNIPISDDGSYDDFRIRSALKTINYLIDNNAKVILMSHFGRPKGEYNEKYSLKKVSEILEKLLGKSVVFSASKEVVDENVYNDSMNLKDGDVMLIENTRFVKGEEKNDPEFSKKLASLGDIFINDAFGTAHRAHASNVGVTHFLPSCAGFLLEDEIKYINTALEAPKRPFIAILGGFKVSDKIEIIKFLLEKVDKCLIGGAMANTFLAANGIDVKNSAYESDKIDLALDLLKKYQDKIVLPVDVVTINDLGEINKYTLSQNMNDSDMIYDIGRETIDLYSNIIKDANTVIWNGPMGVFEKEEFRDGTFGIAKALADSNCISIVGGGESASALEISGYKDSVTHVSTGGGAFLEMIEGKVLPGIDALDEK